MRLESFAALGSNEKYLERHLYIHRYIINKFANRIKYIIQKNETDKLANALYCQVTTCQELRN